MLNSGTGWSTRLRALSAAMAGRCAAQRSTAGSPPPAPCSSHVRRKSFVAKGGELTPCCIGDVAFVIYSLNFLLLGFYDVVRDKSHYITSPLGLFYLIVDEGSLMIPVQLLQTH